MAYLDSWAVRTAPQWWTAALYQEVPGKGFQFRGYLPSRQLKWADFHAYQMANYSVMNGWRVYPFYWDTLARQWMRREGQPALAGDKLPAKGFDATGGTQQPAPDHDPTEPHGEAQLTLTGKLALGALVGGAAWYLYEFGWPFGSPQKKGKRR